MFKSAYEPNSEINKVWKIFFADNDYAAQEMGAHLVAHGDGVKDVSFAVEDLEGIMIQCRKKGVSSIMMKMDEIKMVDSG